MPLHALHAAAGGWWALHFLEAFRLVTVMHIVLCMELTQLRRLYFRCAWESPCDTSKQYAGHGPAIIESVNEIQLDRP